MKTCLFNCIKIRPILITKLSLLLILMTAQANAQETIQSIYMLDRGTDRSKELEVVFQTMWGELTANKDSYMNNSDKELVTSAVFDVSYYVEAQEIAKEACDYFSSQQVSDVDVHEIMLMIDAAKQYEYDGKEVFQESTFQALSAPAKERFNELATEQAFSINSLQNASLDVVAFAHKYDRARTLGYIENFCEVLPEVMDMYKDGKLIHSETEIRLGEQ